MYMYSYCVKTELLRLRKRWNIFVNNTASGRNIYVEII